LNNEEYFVILLKNNHCGTVAENVVFCKETIGYFSF